MNLGVILAIGESLSDLEVKGQLKRLIDYNIREYSKAFDKVFIFSYEDEKNFKLPKNCQLVANTSGLHRYLYSILMPVISFEKIKKCDVLRGLQLSGGIPAATARLFYGRRFVINYGYDYSKFAKIEGKLFQSFLYKIIEKPIFALASAVIVTSSEIKEELAKRVKKSKTHFIPNGVDTRLFRKIGSRLKQKLTVMFIGRLEKQKNLENLLEALSIFKAARLIFYGQGSAKFQLKTLARKLKVNLTINDPVEYQRIPRVLSAADVFVLPSLEEGNPKILLEAMACAKAVVGSNVKGIKEIIKNNYNGLLTETDPQSILQTIKKFENESLREKLGENARKYVARKYDIHKLLGQEVSLLKKIAMAR